MSTIEIMSEEELFGYFKLQDDGTYDVIGQKFDSMEISRAKDFYCTCKYYNIFQLEREELVHFLECDGIGEDIGVKLVLALLIREEDFGYFLMQEDDKRLLAVAKRRIETSQYRLDLDSPIIIAKR